MNTLLAKVMEMATCFFFILIPRTQNVLAMPTGLMVFSFTMGVFLLVVNGWYFEVLCIVPPQHTIARGLSSAHY